MANLTSTDVTVIEDTIETGQSTGRRRVTRKTTKGRYTLVLGGQGTTTNTIPASALGLTRITNCSSFIKSDNTVIVPATPSADGSLILLCAVTNSTDGSRAAPADFTGTFTGYVEGVV